jgi:hypothetical protein
MPDLFLSALDLFADPEWGGIALAVVIVVLALGLSAKIINSGTTDDLTRDELRLLRAFNEQAKGDPRAYLSVEFAAYRAKVGEYDVKLRRLKELATCGTPISRPATSVIAPSGSPPTAYAEPGGDVKES